MIDIGIPNYKLICICGKGDHIHTVVEPPALAIEEIYFCDFCDSYYPMREAVEVK